MKTFNKTYYYEHPWLTVANFFWKRYPSPYSKHVISEDVLERKVLEDGRLYSKRLLEKVMTTRIPMFIQRHIGGLRNEHVLEESIIDPHSQSIETITWNIGSLSKYMIVVEQCTFRPDRSILSSSSVSMKSYSQLKTEVVKNTWTTTDWKSRWTSILNRYLIYNYKSKAEAANKGFLFAINKGLNYKPASQNIISKTLLQSASEVRGTATDKVNKLLKI